MTLPFQSVFNSDGEEDTVNAKRRFLGQRKWIILTSGILYALDNEIINFSGKIGFVETNINANTDSALLPLAMSSIAFSAYMAFAAYAYVKKYEVDKRQEFERLQLAKSDTFSDKIDALQELGEKLSSEMEQNREIIISLENGLISAQRLMEQALAALTNLGGPPDSTASSDSDFTGLLGAATKPKPKGGLFGLADEQLDDGQAYEAHRILSQNWERQFNEANSKRMDAARQIAGIKNRLTHIRALVEGLEDESALNAENLVSQQNLRSKLLQGNERDLKIYLVLSVFGDLIATLPTIIGTIYSISYLLRTFG